MSFIVILKLKLQLAFTWLVDINKLQHLTTTTRLGFLMTHMALFHRDFQYPRNKLLRV